MGDFLGIFDKFLRPKPSGEALKPVAEEQAVLVAIRGVDFDQFVPLEDKIAAALENTGLGELDGNEVGEGETTIFLYGPNAERLFEHIRPILLSTPICRFGKVVIRYGKPGALSRTVSLE